MIAQAQDDAPRQAGELYRAYLAALEDFRSRLPVCDVEQMRTVVRAYDAFMQAYGRGSL